MHGKSTTFSTWDKMHIGIACMACMATGTIGGCTHLQTLWIDSQLMPPGSCASFLAAATGYLTQPTAANTASGKALCPLLKCIYVTGHEHAAWTMQLRMKDESGDRAEPCLP